MAMNCGTGVAGNVYVPVFTVDGVADVTVTISQMACAAPADNAAAAVIKERQNSRLMHLMSDPADGGCQP